LTGRIRASELSLDELLREVAHPGAGAIATFLGVVRNVNEGRPVTLLEYQAYVTMAEAELDRIVREIEREVPQARVATTHRVGTLAVGDVAVACAASAPHRSEAFRACRLLIDRLKARLPIWKREHGPDGPYWVGWEDARCANDAEHEHHPHHHGHGD
jgi:molybdopterin synthase catalytic subunit